MDAVVRLHLDKLQAAARPASRESRRAGRLLVAQHCQGAGDQRAAIEFLILAKRSEEALELAVTHSRMEAYAGAGQGGLPEEYKKVALYYEGQHDYQKAGEFWLVCKDYSRRSVLPAVRRARGRPGDRGGRPRALGHAHAHAHRLPHGRDRRRARDPNYIFRLYMALGNYLQAAKTAIIIARQEQELGNYRVARRSSSTPRGSRCRRSACRRSSRTA